MDDEGRAAPRDAPLLDEGLLAAARRGEALPMARVLVATPSVNPSLVPGGSGEGPVAERTAAWLDGWGFDTRIDEVETGRFNVVARRSGSRPGATLLLNGHLDTVGVDGMTVPAFDPVVREGRLTGRGACDMKGGVAAALAAAATLAGEGLESGTLIVALTADEEHASVGMEALVASGITADGAVVCEPTNLTVMPAHKGFVWIDVDFRGRAAHGSRPETGIDAVRHAGLYLAALDRLASDLERRPPHPLLGHGSFHAGTIRGGTAPSVYPDACLLTLERRTLPGERTGDVVAEFETVLRDLGSRVPHLEASLEPGLDRPGTEVAGESPLVEGLLRACVHHDREPGVEGMTAWVDAAFLNRAGIPAVCFGPGSIADAHASDESCSIAEIEACAEILTTFARGFLEEGGQSPRVRTAMAPPPKPVP